MIDKFYEKFVTEPGKRDPVRGTLEYSMSLHPPGSAFRAEIDAAWLSLRKCPVCGSDAEATDFVFCELVCPECARAFDERWSTFCSGGWCMHCGDAVIGSGSECENCAATLAGYAPPTDCG